MSFYWDKSKGNNNIKKMHMPDTNGRGSIMKYYIFNFSYTLYTVNRNAMKITSFIIFLSFCFSRYSFCFLVYFLVQNPPVCCSMFFKNKYNNNCKNIIKKNIIKFNVVSFEIYCCLKNIRTYTCI